MSLDVAGPKHEKRTRKYGRGRHKRALGNDLVTPNVPRQAQGLLCLLKSNIYIDLGTEKTLIYIRVDRGPD